MIAMALSCQPQLLIADEPTTALDVTIQAQILDLLRELQASEGMSILFITHDLGVIAEMADDVAVMYASRVVEHAPVKELFGNPRAPVHARPVCFQATARQAEARTTHDHSRHGSQPAALPRRLQVPPALFLLRTAVPERRADAT